MCISMPRLVGPYTPASEHVGITGKPWKRIEANAGRGDDLWWAAEVLDTEFVPGKKI